MASTVLQRAISTVNDAVAADNDGQLERALDLYKRSIELFLHELKYNRSIASRTVLTARITSYVERAEAIKRTLAHAPPPPSNNNGAATGSGPKPAASDSSDDDDAFDLSRELDKRVGMADVKRQLLDFEKGLALDRRRVELLARSAATHGGAAKFPHVLFRGPPGCGKTSMARLLARALRKLGVLKHGHLVEVQRGDLVAGHVGQTALRTRAALESARGGVLFVDECYRLSAASSGGSGGGGGHDFGQEAIDELMAGMERGDPCVVFAGCVRWS